MVESMQMSRAMTVLGVGLITLIGGCALAGPRLEPLVHGSLHPAPVMRHVETSRLKRYDNLAGLSADSTLVAYITATSLASVEVVGDVPFTVTTIRVDQVVRGSYPGPTLRLRQTGSAAQDALGTSVVLPQQKYLVFLHPFFFTVGQPTDQWFITGDVAGLFHVVGNNLVRLDRDSPNIASILPKSDVERQITDG